MTKKEFISYLERYSDLVELTHEEVELGLDFCDICDMYLNKFGGTERAFEAEDEQAVIDNMIADLNCR